MNEQLPPLLDHAMRLHREGQLGAAASLYREILRDEPLDFDATNLLGSIYLRQGEAGEALATIGMALQINPKSVEARLNFGYVLSQLDRLDEALDSFRQAADLRPDFAEPHSAIATVLALLERHEDAVASWRRAIELLPDSAELHNNLAAALIELARHEEALTSCRRAIELQPDTAELHNNLGLALAGRGRLEEAAASYRRAIEIEPDHEHAHNNLGVALRKLGQHQEAAESYRRAVEIDPDLAEAHNNLGIALGQLDRIDEAMACYHRAIEIKPDFAEAYANLGDLQVKTKRYDTAIAAFRRALAIDPELPEAHAGLASALGECRQLDEAIAHYERALEIKPDSAQTYSNLGFALRTAGRLEEGQRAIETAIRLAPKYAEAYYNLTTSGKRFSEGDRYLGAMEELARDESLSDDLRMKLDFALGKALADVGRHEDAFSHLVAGNALKRQQTAYDEAATLGMLDLIRAVFTAELMRQKAGLGHPSEVPVFIIGMPRSGTTLVEQILASHSRVFGADETLELHEAIGQSTKPGEKWTDYFEAVVDMTGPQLWQLGASYVERMAVRAPAALRITDKLPGNYSFAGLIHLALPNARIIHACRDPVDTCLSCFSLLFTGSQPFTYDLAELGRYYSSYQALMAHWREILPPGVMLEVQYEELVADLERHARRIIAHCGLDWEDACLEFYKTERPVWTASMTQVRQPIYRGSVGRWRRYKDWLGPLLAGLGVDPQKA